MNSNKYLSKASELNKEAFVQGIGKAVTKGVLKAGRKIGGAVGVGENAGGQAAKKAIRTVSEHRGKAGLAAGAVGGMALSGGGQEKKAEEKKKRPTGGTVAGAISGGAGASYGLSKHERKVLRKGNAILGERASLNRERVKEFEKAFRSSGRAIDSVKKEVSSPGSTKGRVFKKNRVVQMRKDRLEAMDAKASDLLAKQTANDKKLLSKKKKGALIAAGVVGGAVAGNLAGKGIDKLRGVEKKASIYTGPTAVAALRRLAQKKKDNPLLAKAYESAHNKAKIYGAPAKK